MNDCTQKKTIISKNKSDIHTTDSSKIHPWTKCAPSRLHCSIRAQLADETAVRCKVVFLFIVLEGMSFIGWSVSGGDKASRDYTCRSLSMRICACFCFAQLMITGGYFFFLFLFISGADRTIAEVLATENSCF